MNAFPRGLSPSLAWRTLAAPSLASRPAARTRLLLAVLVTGCLVGGMLVGESPSSASPTTRALAPTHSVSQEGLLSLPAAAQGPVSASLGRDNVAYRLTPAADGYRAVSPRQKLALRFTASGVSVTSHHGSFGLALREIGHGSTLHSVSSSPPRRAVNQITYAFGDGVREWYANGPLGLEQGFDLQRAPAGASGPLTLSLAMSGNLRPRLGEGGVSLTGHGAALRYAGLVVRDASGRRLPAWFQLRHGRILIRIDDRGARYPLKVDPWTSNGELTASDAAANAQLGDAVAVSYNTIVVGAPRANGSAGAVYVFTRGTDGWANATQTAELTPSDPQLNDAFGPQELGYSVAISGSTIVAGAPYWTNYTPNSDGEYQGAVYVWTQPATGVWANATQTAILSATDLSSNYYLGTSVAAQGSTIVAGAPEHMYETPRNGEGAVYVYIEPATGGWVNANQNAELGGYDDEPGDGLGVSVAISGSTIVAGAPLEVWGGSSNEGLGGVYVWTEPPSGWVNRGPTAELTASDAVREEDLGYSVAISGSTIVGGAPFHGTGAVYVWTLPASGEWVDATQTAELTSSNASALDVGWSVALAGPSTIFAGSPPASGNVQGVVDEWTLPYYGVWIDATQNAVLTAANGGGDDEFGRSVAASDSTLAIGAPGLNGGAGAAYVYGGGYKVSGRVLTSCGCEGVGGVTILVTGTATDGTAISETSVSSDADGSWSVMVPPGSYTAGPTADDTTIDGTGFDPEQYPDTGTFGVTTGPVTGLDFKTCTVGGSSDEESVHLSLAHAAHGTTSSVTACTSVYTITVGGTVPAPNGTIVDPGPGARYNENSDGDADYRGPTPFFSYLDSAQAEAPACLSTEDAEKYGRRIDWYSYIKGPVTLPKYTVKVAYDQRTGQTSLIGTPQAGEAEMTKVWVWRGPVLFVNGKRIRYSGQCHLEAEVPFMYIPVLKGSGFTIVVAWGFPFEPSGVLGSLTKNEYVETVEELQHYAPGLVTSYRRTTDAVKFVGWILFKEVVQHVLLELLTSGAATAKYVASGVNVAANTPAIATAIARGATTLVHYGGPTLALFELKSYFNNANAFESGESIMSAVIRGNFHTVPNPDANSSQVVGGTTLGITVKSTRDQNLSIQVSRRAYVWPDGSTAYQGPLPWANNPAGSKYTPFTANPFHNYPTNIFNGPYLNIDSGDAAHTALINGAKQLPAVNQAINYGGLYTVFPDEQNSAPTPSCPTLIKNGAIVLDGPDYALSADTVCWLFKDGEA